MVGVIDLGEGAREVLARPATGRVVAVYRRAAYLRLGGRLVALVSAGIPSGPLHLRCSTIPALRVGESVAGDGARLAGGAWALRCDGPVWHGALPGREALARRADDALVRAGLHPDAERLAAPLGDGGLEGVEALAAAVGGRGPGLTPSGDDLLAGVLVVARLAWGPAARRRLDAVLAAVRTTEVAGAFLAWAARGQSVAPAHDWLVAVAAGDRPAGEAALHRLHAMGASSGRHLAAGLALGVAQLPRVESQTARAGISPGLLH